MADVEAGPPAKKSRGRSSHTAAKVAHRIVFAAQDPTYAGLLPEGAAKSLEEFAVAAGALRPWMSHLFETELYRRGVLGMMSSLWPGELMRLVLRKRFMDDEARAAIADGASQLLIVGAGFDTLGLRIAGEFPTVGVVEIDTPATSATRATAMEKISLTPQNHSVVGAELGSVSLGEVVERVPDWDSECRSVTVAEGVLMYLSRVEVQGFLSEFRSHSGAHSRLLFSYLTADDEGRPDMGRWSGVTRTSLKLLREPLRWCLPEGELEGFLGGAGYRLLGPKGRYDFKERYLTPAGIDQPVGTIERFAVAESVLPV